MRKRENERKKKKTNKQWAWGGVGWGVQNLKKKGWATITGRLKLR